MTGADHDRIGPYASARQMREAVANGAISARELLDLHLARIEEVNPAVNALVSLDADRAMSSAASADDAQARGEAIGALHGLPFAVKDTHAVKDWRTTFGSPLFADNVARYDDLVVERIRAAGAVIVAKTNTPEMAAGSHTFNPVFGTTLNPYDLTRSAGGSSGGAAAALASGMVALAEGSDMGGSLRNPASFCNVVGLRPSVGTVPQWPTTNAWETTAVVGPLARDVGDLALLLSVIGGPDPRVPQALAPQDYAAVIAGEARPDGLRGLRVAFSPDLGGVIEVDREVAAVTSATADLFAAEGAQVSETAPDLAEADQVFRTLRAWHFHARFADLLAANPDRMKASLAANIRAGADLSGLDVARALEGRTRLAERMVEFFDSYDVLLLPVSQVPPFPADQEFPTAINGTPMRDYLDWMRSAYAITVTGCPAISVPAGSTADGLPVGVQLVTRHNTEAALLAIAAAFERVSAAAGRRPDLGAAATSGGPR